MSDLNFLDLVILKKIDADSTVEKFGSLINTSFFETANLLGTIKLKGYINIESSIGGASSVYLTEEGKKILEVASQKAKEPLSPLDNAILQVLASGARDLDSMQHALNIRSSDLAFHINKLVEQGFMDFEVRSAKVHFLLTESGFNITGSIKASTFPGTQQEVPSRQEGAPIAPPWVNPADIRGREQKVKEDVAHLIEPQSGAREEKKPETQLSEEEQKKKLKLKRTFSKLQFYFFEYAPYIILIATLLAVIAGALFLSLAKIS
ncbi:MAG: hypothetical protein QXT25_01905 [Candidatus Anstonellaceae archaeon]